MTNTKIKQELKEMDTDDCSSLLQPLIAIIQKNEDKIANLKYQKSLFFPTGFLDTFHYLETEIVKFASYQKKKITGNYQNSDIPNTIEEHRANKIATLLDRTLSDLYTLKKEFHLAYYDAED